MSDPLLDVILSRRPVEKHHVLLPWEPYQHTQPVGERGVEQPRGGGV